MNIGKEGKVQMRTSHESMPNPRADGEFDVTTSDDILDFKVHEFRVESELLDDTSVLARRKSRVIFRLCTRHNHLSRRENQRRRLWIANTHNNSGKTLQN